jgi:hypothetical protein
MNLRTKVLGLVLGGMGFLMAASAVRAESITLVYGGSAASGGGTTYAYDAFVSIGSKVQTNDYFVIYDFVGYTGVHSEDPTWTFSTQTTGPNPPAQSQPDTGIVNLIWTYNGAADINGFSALNNPLMQFKAESTIALEGNVNYSAQDQQFQPLPAPPHFTTSGNSAVTTGPSAVPLPASAWGGLVLLAALAGKRVKQKMLA